MELLLLSNSTLPGEPFFTWPRPYVSAFLQERSRVAFVPFAAGTDQQDAYTERVREVFSSLGADLFGLHTEKDPVAALDTADMIAVGGGNTFLLLRALYRTQLLKPIVEKVRQGVPYLGWSAGSNVACPTVRTTNDMPIVEPPSLKAMHLVPFQINPHYIDPSPGSTHMGETREVRIREFHEENDEPVAGLREGAILRVEGPSIALKGVAGARIFRRGLEPLEFLPGAAVEEILEPKDGVRRSS